MSEITSKSGRTNGRHFRATGIRCDSEESLN